MKVQEYCLSEEVVVMKPFSTDHLTLPAGTFVKPIHYTYVPQHVLKDEKNRWFNKEIHCFVYCNKGTFMVPQKSIREIG